MRRFEVHAGEALIGWSRLEHVDSCMAVAFGSFEAAEAYAAVQESVIATRGAGQSELQLSLRFNGVLMNCDRLYIADYSDVASIGGIELTAFGIDTSAKAFVEDE